MNIREKVKELRWFIPLYGITVPTELESQKHTLKAGLNIAWSVLLGLGIITYSAPSRYSNPALTNKLMKCIDINTDGQISLEEEKEFLRITGQEPAPRDFRSGASLEEFLLPSRRYHSGLEVDEEIKRVLDKYENSKDK